VLRLAQVPGLGSDFRSDPGRVTERDGERL
jgi:hypothetical protein